MAKYYFEGSELLDNPDPDFLSKQRCFLSPYPDNAKTIHTRDEAEKHCAALNRGVEVELLHGGPHTCTNFQVEELPSGGFVLTCETPSAIGAYKR